MKLILAGVIAWAAAAAAAGEPAQTEFVERRAPGRAFEIVDAGQAPAACLGAIARRMEMMSGVPVEVSRGSGADGLALARAAVDRGAGAAVALVEAGAGAPALAVWPEDRMAAVNLSRLSAGADAKRLAGRIEREVWRAFALAAGGVESEQRCVVKTVLSEADLDALESPTASPPVAMRIARNAPRFGFGQIERVPYFVACMRGWAPAPTNDAQRKAWAAAVARKAAAGKGK